MLTFNHFYLSTIVKQSLLKSFLTIIKISFYMWFTKHIHKKDVKSRS